MRQGDSYRQTLPKYVFTQVERKVKEQRRALRAVKSRSKWEARRSRLERFLLDAIGGYPDAGPLNARTVAVHRRNGYRIENVLFESLPGFELNANLYVPDGLAAPAPAIVCPTGHSAKTEPHYQEQAQGLCRMGCVALIFDCLGRGERSMGNEHFDVGSQCQMLGQNLMRYFIWDNRRAVDYLLTRPEVDPSRIGCTGTSGGGRTTIFHSALDQRVACAVPLCCQLSVLEQVRLRYTGCPEAYIWDFLGSGFDVADVLAMIAPRPLRLIVASQDDINSLDIAQAAFELVKHVYSLYGADDKVSQVTVDDPHGYTKAMRVQMYEWMNRWLDHRPPTVEEPPLELEPAAVINCGISGKTTVASLNAAAADTLARSLGQLPDYRPVVREVLRIPGERTPGKLAFTETMPIHGYPRIEEYLVESEKDVIMPVARFVPAADAPNLLYLAECGCEACYVDQMPDLLRQHGIAVITASIRGFGNLRAWPSPWEHHSFCKSEWELTQGLCEAGETLTGLRVLDAQAVLDVVVPPDGKVVLLANGRAALPAVHLAVLDDRVCALAMVDALGSLAQLAASPRNQWGFCCALPNVLKHYDLPYLLGSLAPKPLLIVDPRAADFSILDDAAIQLVFQPVLKAYAGNLADLRIEATPSQGTVDDRRRAIAQWAQRIGLGA